MTHRIAGPVYRMERYLSEVAKGDFSSILKLRKRDELKGLADAINNMTKSLSEFSSENRTKLDRLTSVLSELDAVIAQTSPDKDKISALARTAAEQAKELKNNLVKYQV